MVVAQERYQHYSLPEEQISHRRQPQLKRLPRKKQYILAGLVTLTFITGIVVAFYYAQVLVTGYKISRLNKELTSLQQETNLLSEEVSKLTSLETVEAVATKKLGMVKPDSSHVVKVKADLALVSGEDASLKASVTPVEAEGGSIKKYLTGHPLVQGFASMVGRIGG